MLWETRHVRNLINWKLIILLSRRSIFLKESLIVFFFNNRMPELSVQNLFTWNYLFWPEKMRKKGIQTCTHLSYVGHLYKVIKYQLLMVFHCFSVLFYCLLCLLCSCMYLEKFGNNSRCLKTDELSQFLKTSKRKKNEEKKGVGIPFSKNMLKTK